MPDWILQCNPKVWDVFSWWEQEETTLDSWTVSHRLSQISRGDRFALWVGGQEAGVYAIGEIAGEPEGPFEPRSGGYWVKPPRGEVWDLPLRTRRYFFHAPLRKADLVMDPEFANALIVRMPGMANPIPVTPGQWRAIDRLAGPVGQSHKRPKAGDVAIMERPLGAVIEEILVASSAIERVRHHREAQLLKRYEKRLGRQLVVKTARLPTGERLVIDAFDSEENCLIEAKASSARGDIRSAIGQLFDYRRHIVPRAKLVILVPERPSDDLVDLVKSLGIAIVYADRGGEFASA